MDNNQQKNPFLWLLGLLMIFGLLFMAAGAAAVVVDALAGIVITFYGGIMVVSAAVWYAFLRRR